MKRVLFDLGATQGYGRTRFHGGGEYAKRVFRGCIEQLPPDVSLEAHLDPSRFTDPWVNEFAAQYSVKVHAIASASDLEGLLHSGDYDRYYSALPVGAHWEFKIPASTTFIFTLHGVRGILTRDWRLRTKYGRTAFHGFAMACFFLVFGRRFHRRTQDEIARKITTTTNRKIVTVSNYGKFSFMAALPGIDLEDARILDSVTEDVSPKRDAGVLARAQLSSRKFFLVVSANRYEKNSYRALKAIDSFFSDVGDRPEFATHRVAITGVRSESRFVRLLRLKNAYRFVFLDYVSPGEMEELYASANALVYASLSEGYGYPPVQAMRYGTPSICAGGTSIPEICGDAAIYFNPYDVEEIVARLFEVSDPSVRSALVPKLAPREHMLRERQRYALNELVRMIVGD